MVDAVLELALLVLKVGTDVAERRVVRASKRRLETRLEASLRLRHQVRARVAPRRVLRRRDRGGQARQVLDLDLALDLDV